MLTPCCIVIDFFVNNQPDALINYPNLFCYKTLHVSGILSAHHQEFSTVHSALLSFMKVFDDRFQAQSGWKCLQFRAVRLYIRARLWSRVLLKKLIVVQLVKNFHSSVAFIRLHVLELPTFV